MTDPLVDASNPVADSLPPRVGRLADLDLLRVLGIVAVIAGHVWGLGLMRPLVYTWHVPLFFLLSGYLWIRRRPIAAEVRKRWNSLALPYLCWLALIGAAYFAVLALTHKLTASAALDVLLGGSYLGRPFSVFWFMSALFAVAIAYRLIQGLPLWAHWVIAVALLAVAYVWPHTVAAVPLGIGTGLCGLIFVVAGHSLKLVRDRIPMVPLIGSVVLLAGIGLVVAGLATPLDMKQGNFGTPVWSAAAAILICGGAVLAVEALRPILAGGVSTYVLLLAGVGTTVVLTHAGVLWLLHTSDRGSVLAFVLATLLPWALGLFLVRTRLGPYLVGVPRQFPLGVRLRRSPSPSRPGPRARRQRGA